MGGFGSWAAGEAAHARQKVCVSAPPEGSSPASPFLSSARPLPAPFAAPLTHFPSPSPLAPGATPSNDHAHLPKCLSSHAPLFKPLASPPTWPGRPSQRIHCPPPPGHQPYPVPKLFTEDVISICNSNYYEV